MVGDENVDCTAEVDSGGIRFCEECAAGIERNQRVRMAKRA